MAEVYPISVVLDKLKGFTPLQRILMATSGTLQSTLSAYFDGPVTIEVLSQSIPEPDEGRPITRQVSLVCNFKSVCYAKTTVYACGQEAIDLIQAQELGLGQIMQKLGIKPDFRLKRVGQDDDIFWRLYVLSGQGSGVFSSLTYHIREEFPKHFYED